MRYTFYGHACFEVDTGREKILFDPFLTGNTLAAVAPQDVEADYILISHGHGDHIGDAPAIAERTKAKVVAIPEVINLFPETVQDFQPMNLGGNWKAPFGNIKMVPAMHSSGVTGGIACGFVISFKNGPTVYYAGDTALFGDMKLVGNQFHIDYAILPIGDNYTMGPDDALLAAKWVGAKAMIPIHYNTWPIIAQEPNQFLETAKKAGMLVHLVSPGETISL